MKQKAKNPHGSRKPSPASVRAEAERLAGTGRETKPTRETFPKRTKRPGPAGLANEARPGLGSRGTPKRAPASTKGRSVAQDREPLGRNAPLPPRTPREQPADTFAHELERNTGVSGHSSAD